MGKAFNLTSEFQPTGDQPEAIEKLATALAQGQKYQTLLGVTGSGKTFTVANVIQKLQKPTLILSHNKTLAAQLYSEFKAFFPDNAVEYFVSYYDYYQPEAYLPTSDTYIEKDLSINDEIEKLRLAATSALLSGRQDVIVVSSVSCIYGMGNPEDFFANVISIEVGTKITRNHFLRKLVDSLYSRNDVEFKRGTFRVKGDSVDIFVADSDFAFRIIFWGDEIEEIRMIDPISGDTIEKTTKALIYPATLFVTTKERINSAISIIQDDMMEQVRFFQSQGKPFEAKRIEERVTYDLEMIKELGYCSGIENYSRYFDGRKPGARPFCLLDYFPKNFLMVIDESHVTIPQLRAMYGGDRSRKTNLVEYGFRLPAAMDNRPLKFDEFETVIGQTIFVSATPADYELAKCEGEIVEQVIRPTGLIDPQIVIRPTVNQVDDLLEEIRITTEKEERILVTTLTKRMAEELSKYLSRMSVRCEYIHSDVETLDRIKIIENLRNGFFDVLIGVNLLREGLDLPEVSLVAILDADKEGFLRSARSLTQTAGRAARNINGRVIMYADVITNSMQKTIEETNRRRLKQLDYNLANNITPRSATKNKSALVSTESPQDMMMPKAYAGPDKIDVAADPLIQYMDRTAIEKAIAAARKKMEEAAKKLEFIEAAQYRDEIRYYESKLGDNTAKKQNHT